MADHTYRGFKIIRGEARSPYTGKPVWKIVGDEELDHRRLDYLEEAKAHVDYIIKDIATAERESRQILRLLRMAAS